jgi:hypothetical protein
LPVNATDYRSHLERLAITSPELARLFGYSIRTSQRWDKVGPPIAVAALMALAKNKAQLLDMIDKAL